jgi:hypothetical protein
MPSSRATDSISEAIELRCEVIEATLRSIAASRASRIRRLMGEIVFRLIRTLIVLRPSWDALFAWRWKGNVLLRFRIYRN